MPFRRHDAPESARGRLSGALGIDFGSTKCCAYVFKDGALQLVPTAAGAPSLPSWVAFTQDKALVGQRARSQAPRNPTHSTFGIKRLLGRKFYAAETTWLREALPVDMVPAPNGDAWFHIGGMVRSPQELVSYLLEHIREQAALVLGSPVESAVLAIPAFFDERQRRALVEAATLAGLRVERLLHSPTAAAIAYQHQHPQEQGRWAVLDLGGGSLDVSVIDFDGQRFEVLSAVGDPLLGGDDFDRRLAEPLIDAFYDQHGIDLGADPAALHRIFDAARAAKHELSQVARSTAITIPMIARSGDEMLSLEHPGIERTAFEDLIAEDLDRIAEPCALALEDIGFGTDDMDAVLLLGGMARVPKVLETVAYLFNTRPVVLPGGTQISAMGAALYAASLRGDTAPVLLDDVSPHSIGIKIKEGRFSPVVHRRSLVPCREQKVFATARQQQASVVFEVYQGEGERVNENVYLGRFTLSALGKASHVVVAFNLNESSMLSIAAGDGRTEERVSLEAARGLSDDEIANLLRERPSRSRILNEPNPHLERVSQRALSTAPPPPSDAPRAVSVRPGPRRRTSPPPASGVPRQLPKRSLPPPAYANAQTEAPPPDAEAIGVESPIEIADDSLVGTTVGGRYVIDDIIADGGMGRVYLARHDVLNKKFALKVLHAELAQNDDLALRFVREAQAAAQIDSPHVIDISDFGRLPDGTGFFVMEYLAGNTLAALIQERGALPAKLIIDVAIQLTDGLAAAHDMGVVHRDLKPENVTLIQRGGHPYFCKILDFGIAKAPTSDSHKHETLAGTLLGTPHYMAPEQIDGVHMDARCDIYSLGAVMYEMATGKPPFEAESLVGVLVKHKTEDPLPVRSHKIAAQCPLELQAIIQRCLAKKPADRFQSARELQTALKAV